MSIIKSISGIRGTVGGEPGDNLTPVEIIKFSQAFGTFIRQEKNLTRPVIVIGRDSRISGKMISDLISGILTSQGIDVIDIGQATTPTVAMAVIFEKADGAIVITASHNPQGWNALKFLGAGGEFISKDAGEKILSLAEEEFKGYVLEEGIGSYSFNPNLEERHIAEIIKLPLVDKEVISKRDFKIVIDGINSVGARAIPNTLEALGVKNKIVINDSLDGHFAHNPEPLAENLSEIMARVKTEKADLGIVVDPDVDRLAFIDEKGEIFGEEYTLVAIADYVLANFSLLNQAYPEKYQKATVSNLSSSRALRDISLKYGVIYEAAAVGEVNVVKKMKELKAVIGGEGNGGIIYPALHYGRDAMVGAALFLSALALSGKKVSELRAELPNYFMVKDKLALSPELKINLILDNLKKEYQRENITDIDGLKIDWDNYWVHLRVSNTEPIIRIYAEAETEAEAKQKVEEIKAKILDYNK
ncbi:phosphoglucosamine mutase [Patescibacteria group bacterium]|nr:phosphoglucosamine mutase [Patescibacteria group bacterium]